MVSKVNEKFEKQFKEQVVDHCMRVGKLSQRLAIELEIKPSLVSLIHIGGDLHDIGKREINEEVLFKDGNLTFDEFEHIKAHVFYSANIAKQEKNPSFIIKSIYHHHENFDGSGYPVGLKGEDIPLGARIIRICDMFDALTNDRSYRKKETINDAIKIMDLNSNFFDPDIYSRFKKLINKDIYNLNSKMEGY